MVQPKEAHDLSNPRYPCYKYFRYVRFIFVGICLLSFYSTLFKKRFVLIFFLDKFLYLYLFLILILIFNF